MATYFTTGTGNPLTEAYGDGDVRPLSQHLAYVKPTEFGILNADGSRTYVYGKGFTYDAGTGKFTGGEITSIAHYTNAGAYIDDIRHFATPISATDFQTALEESATGLTFNLGNLLFIGDDTLNAYHKTDGGAALDGFGGNDLIQGSQFGDTISGGVGDDLLFGNRGSDVINGGDGKDVIHGARGQDVINGDGSPLSPNLGNDRLFGGAGNDQIDGGAGGNDRLTGGSGHDTFFFHFYQEGSTGLVNLEWGNDVITDFEVGTDHLVLDMGLKPVDILTYANDADGNAVITLNSGNTVTLIGIDANTTSFADVLA